MRCNGSWIKHAILIVCGYVLIPSRTANQIQKRHLCCAGSINSDNAAASNEPNSMAIGAIVATGVLCGIGAVLCIGGLVFACKKCVSAAHVASCPSYADVVSRLYSQAI
ncbi:Hypothetical predicted protein, partial [Mytilus galloprovincialis]